MGFQYGKISPKRLGFRGILSAVECHIIPNGASGLENARDLSSEECYGKVDH